MMPVEKAAPAIQLQGLRKVFAKGKNQVVAVDDLSLTVQRGEVFGLLGPNGAGKTTTVEICEGLQRPSAGSVQILGHQWRGSQRQQIRQRIGVSLQETRFFDKQTVTEILHLFRSFYDAGRSVEEAMDLLSLREKAHARAMHLSGGQRQRLAVACALVSQPELLFLDEPTTGLDPQSRRQLWEVVQAFQQKGGTVLLTTHYMEEAEQLCDRVGVVDHGRLIALDTPRQLMANLGGGHVVEVQGTGMASKLQEEQCKQLPGVSSCDLQQDSLRLTVDSPQAVIPPLVRCLDGAGVPMDELTTRHTSLEDVFVALTGRHLRDEA